MISEKLLKNIMISSVVVLIIAIAFASVGCVDRDDSDERASGDSSLMIKGSDTVLPLSQAMAEEFMLLNPDKSITVVGGGSGVGISALIDGEVKMAMSSRDIKESEMTSAQANGVNPVLQVVAFDGIAVIVNPENPVDQLTFSQLKGIYDGSISNWAEVGGEDRTITAITRDSSSGTYEYFRTEVLTGDNFRQDALVQPATGGIVQEVGQNRGAIGYIGYAYLNDNVKALALDGGDGYVEANPENIMEGEYPLARPLMYYVDGEPTGLTKEFLDFIRSPTGRDIILDVGYFPV
ncbi:PstS family phosphate ABC transporter substrate-binding protein [Methanolobus sp. WCC5]|uniref:PstS family phosphate ABC transporter substrate-binding protein n=1 Tax=Methanolobus sp. WCC5 TaxID=3125785 RepID=UPI003245DE3A